MPDVSEAVADFLSSNGSLARAMSRSGDFAYEHRPQQMEMAAAVAAALAEPSHLMVEAGTGVGKSFAYLVPLILFGKAAGVKIAVSTYTISLQEQLIHKDIPLLQEHLGVQFKAALCKGRGNYVCLRRLERAEQMGGDLFKPSQAAELARLREWAKITEDGTLSDLELQPGRDTWDLVCSEHDNCLGRACPWQARCFISRARSIAQSADVLVLNHHLFFSDLALREEDASFLPQSLAVVLDEAHALDDAATSHFGIHLSEHGVKRWLRRLFSPDSGKGIFAVDQESEAQSLVRQAWRKSADFFDEITRQAEPAHERGHLRVLKPLTVECDLLGRLESIVEALRSKAEQSDSLEWRVELNALARRGEGLIEAISDFLNISAPDYVYWLEKSGRHRQFITLCSAPVEVAPILASRLYPAFQSVILTSATLSVAGSLEYARRRLGMPEGRELLVGSPFNFARQMKAFFVRDMPLPTDTKAFPPAVARAVTHFVSMTNGQAFVLFTSADLMRDVARRMASFFEKSGLTLLMQGGDLPRHALLNRFKLTQGAVLFGLDSFWTGVDVQGEALSNVIIVRLPFSVPDEPVIEARIECLEREGRNPFLEYSLPEAVLRFRQGVGRLIRTITDTGIIVVLDPRLLRKWYGRYFLRSLPECPVEEVCGFGDDDEKTNQLPDEGFYEC